MMPLNVEQLVQCCGGYHLGNAQLSLGEICTDSRKLQAGQTFVALVGDKHDAHGFVADILPKQPGLLVLQQDWVAANASMLAGHTVWAVQDTLVALTAIAKCVRQLFKGPVVGITGSSGKTTVKEMLAAIARHTLGEPAVLATQGNLNNHIGVPLTLSRLTPEHRFAIIEMGASGPDEIAHLATMAQPTVSLVNNVMAAHVEGFGSIDGVARTKSAIYDGLGATGVAVINVDDRYADSFIAKNVARSTLTFGLSAPGVDVTASDIELTESGARFILSARGEQVPVELSVSGLHNVANSLAAGSCALSAGISLVDVGKGLAAFEAVKGRFNVLRLNDSLTLIDDTYNANPGAVKAAIDTLAQFEGARWLVLGDMGELGAEAQTLHAEVGRYAHQVGLDGVVTVGPLSADTAKSFGGGHAFETHAAAVAFLQRHIAAQAGRINILIKGSRSAQMEKVVQALNDNQRNA